VYDSLFRNVNNFKAENRSAVLVSQTATAQGAIEPGGTALHACQPVNRGQICHSVRNNVFFFSEEGGAKRKGSAA
jgi:hypothetical protein